MRAALHDEDPARAAALTMADVIERKKSAALAANDVRFAATLAALMTELGITAADICDVAPEAPAAAASPAKAPPAGSVPGKGAKAALAAR